MKSRSRAVLDTSSVIGLFAGDPRVVAAFERQDLLLLPVITVGELYYGAMRSALRQSNLKKLEDFANSVQVIGCDFDTARFYGDVKAVLAAQGSPIPENDC